MPNIFRKKFPRNTGIMRGRSKTVTTDPKQAIGLTQTTHVYGHERIRLKRRLNLGPRDRELSVCIQRKLGGIGDIIMTTPTIRMIKKLYPLATITYATDPPLFSLLENNPYIDHLVDFRHINPSSYDFFADITSVCPPYESKEKPPINRIDLFARYIGSGLGYGAESTPVYIPTDEEVKWAQQYLRTQWDDRSKYKLIFLSTGSIDHRRSWPIEYSHELVAQITKLRKDVRIVIDDFTKRGGEWNDPNTLSKELGIRQMAALINECDLFVGPDSGPLHLAGAMEKPIVSIFGPTDPAARINHYKDAIAVTAGLGCQFCWYAHCPYEFACMTKLQVTTVKEAVLNKLEMKLPAKAFERRSFIIDIPNVNCETQLVGSGLVNSIRSLGYPASIGRVAGPEDIVISVLGADNLDTKFTPPHGAMNCIYVAGKLETPPTSKTTTKIKREYDLIVSNESSTLECLRAVGLGVMMYRLDLPLTINNQLLGPVETAYRIIDDATTQPDVIRGAGLIIDMDKNSNGIVATQALINGIPIVLHEDISCAIPNTYITRYADGDWSDLQDYFVKLDDSRLEELQLGCSWGRNNLGEKPTYTLLNLIYNHIYA